MPGHQTQFSPLSVLETLPANLLTELRELYFQERPIQLLRRAAQSCGCGLTQARMILDAVSIETRRRVPDLYERHARVLIGLGKKDEAVRFLAEASGISFLESAALVEALEQAVGFQINAEQAATLQTLVNQRTMIHAVSQLRAMTQIGLIEAYRFVADLMDPDEIKKAPPPAPPGPYTVLRAEPEVAPFVEARLQNCCDPGQWEDIRAALDLYGRRPHESEVERVQIAILGLYNGDLWNLLNWVEAAKKDYRDVLAAAGQEKNPK